MKQGNLNEIKEIIISLQNENKALEQEVEFLMEKDKINVKNIIDLNKKIENIHNDESAKQFKEIQQELEIIKSNLSSTTQLENNTMEVRSNDVIADDVQQVSDIINEDKNTFFEKVNIFKIMFFFLILMFIALELFIFLSKR